MRVKTMTRVVEPYVFTKNGEVISVNVNMGKGRILGEKTINLNDYYKIKGIEVSVGEPALCYF